MKCNVLDCENNKDKNCLEVDNIEISSNGDGMYCSCFKEKLSVRLSQFKLIKAKLNDLDTIIVMLITFGGISHLLDDVSNEIKREYGSFSEQLILDYTSSLGLRASERYVKINIKDNKMTMAEVIKDKDTLSELKKITCNEFKENPVYFNSSILLSHQIEMIKKGIIL